jgi:BolA protein
MKAKIEQLLKAAYDPEFIEVIDESAQHAGHSGNTLGASEGTHFILHIRCNSLASISRVQAHRKIYEVLQVVMPNIHALQINIAAPL